MGRDFSRFSILFRIILIFVSQNQPVMKSILLLPLGLGLGYFFIAHESPQKPNPAPSPGSAVYCAPALDETKLQDDHGPLIQAFRLTHFKITTGNDSAQLYFDQGLSQLFAFNHGEAGRSFKTAIRLDPNAAMPHWGMAMVLGPNYNAALNPSALADINAAITKAQDNGKHATPVEKALIQALDERFPEKVEEDMTPFNAAYTSAMEKMYEAFPSQAEIAVLYIDALMNEHPWNFWMKDGTAQPWTNNTVDVVEKILQQWPDHPGVIHYYIHLTEASQQAEKALPHADKLGALAKGNGHLMHMPSHTYIRTGDYHKGVLVNEAASEADSSYISQCRADGFYPMLLYPHNVHFLAACAFLEGNSRKAINAAWAVSRLADRRYLADNVTVQHFYSIPYYVLTQLQKWDDILRLPRPGESLQYPSALWHYARGMAYCGKGDLKKATIELTALKKIIAGKSLEKQMIWDLNTAQQLVDIARLVLEGELLIRQGAEARAIPVLREAVAIEDKLNYNEPPDWFFSVRLSLGKCLLIAGKMAEAEEVYSEDLLTFRENGWALHGLYKARLAQGKKEAAAQAYARFEKAWQWADITLK